MATPKYKKNEFIYSEEGWAWFAKRAALLTAFGLLGGLFFSNLAWAFMSGSFWYSYLWYGTLPRVLVISLLILAPWFFSRELTKIFFDRDGITDNLVREGMDVRAIVEECCQKIGVQVPEILIIENHRPNAFATGRDFDHGLIGITTSLLKSFKHNPNALRAVIFHELGHLAHKDILFKRGLFYLERVILRVLYFLSRAIRSWLRPLYEMEYRNRFISGILWSIYWGPYAVEYILSFLVHQFMEREADHFALEQGAAVEHIQAFLIFKDPTAYKRMFRDATIESLFENGIMEPSDLDGSLKQPAPQTATPKSYFERLKVWMDSWSNPHTPKDNSYLFVRFIEGIFETHLRWVFRLYKSHPHVDSRIEAAKEYIRAHPECVKHREPVPAPVLNLATSATTAQGIEVPAVPEFELAPAPGLAA